MEEKSGRQLDSLTGRDSEVPHSLHCDLVVGVGKQLFSETI